MPVTDPNPSNPKRFESELYKHIKDLTDDVISHRESDKFDEKLKNRQQRFEAMRSIRGLDYGDMPKTNPWVGCSDIGIPIDAITIQALVARVDRTEFERLPLTRVMAVAPADRPSAPKIEAFLDWQKLNLMRIRIPKLMATRSALILGSYFMKMVFEEDYVYDSKEIFALADPDGGGLLRDDKGEIMEWEVDGDIPLNDSGHAYQIVELEREFKKTTYRGPKMYGRHPSKILWAKDETSQNPNDWDWWSDCYEKSLEWLEDRGAEAGFINIDELKAKVDYKAQQTQSTVDRKRKIKIREWYGKYEVNGKLVDIVAVIAPEYHVFMGWTKDKIKAKTGGTRLCHRCPLPMEGHVMGKSIPEFIKGLRDAIDTIYNQLMDRGARKNNPPIIYSHGSGFDPSKHNFGYRFWPEKVSGTIRELGMAGGESVEFAKLELLIGLIQRLFGVTDTTSGVENPNNKTYGGISTLLAEGNVNIDMLIQSLNESNICMDELIIAINTIYMRRDEDGNAIPVEFPLIDDYSSVMEDPDNPFATITEEELLGKYNYYATGTSLAINTRSIREEALFLYNTVMQTAQINPFVADPTVMHATTEDLFKSFGKKDITIPSVEDMQQKQQDAQQQQMQMMQAAQQQEQQGEMQKEQSKQQIEVQKLAIQEQGKDKDRQVKIITEAQKNRNKPNARK